MALSLCLQTPSAGPAQKQQSAGQPKKAAPGAQRLSKVHAPADHWDSVMPRVFQTASQFVDLQVLATAGVASRRGAEDLILQGKVKVNGKVVSSNVPITRQDKVQLHLVNHSSFRSKALV